jgi:hypothetical protein
MENQPETVMNPRTLVRRALILAALIGAVLTLPACLPVPLGDPAKSVADSRLCGVWEWRDALVNRAVIRQWDQRTYVVDVLTGAYVDDNTTQPRSRSVYKAWLTTLNGQTILTMQPIEIVGVVNGDERPKVYLISRITFENDTLTAAPLDPEFKNLKDVKTPEALEKIVTENTADPKLFVKPIIAVKWTPDQMKGLDKLQETFKEWKP